MFAFSLSSSCLSLCVVGKMLPALENEVMLNPKPSLVDRSILELSVDKLVPPDIYVDRALLRGRLAADDLCEAGGAVWGHRLPWGDSADPDTDPVAKAKARIQELQVEAETLEEAYRNYQQRAVRSTLAHMLPPRARSPQAAHLPQLSGSPLGKRIPYPSHSRSPQRSKVSHTPPSPQNASAISSAVCDIRKAVAPTPPTVVFPEAQNQAAIQPLYLKEVGSQNGSSSPPRHPSAWYSSPKTALLRKTAEGNNPSCNSLRLQPASKREMTSDLILLRTTQPCWWNLFPVQLGSGCTIYTHHSNALPVRRFDTPNEFNVFLSFSRRSKIILSTCFAHFTSQKNVSKARPQFCTV